MANTTDSSSQEVTPQRIIVRHLSGSKANKVEEFPLAQFKELAIGRMASSAIKFDPDQDDLVSREHAKIAQDPGDPNQFTIQDLNSRNGTFVNKQRITGPTRLMPGAVIQLGPGGPELQFDLEPRPADQVRATRVAASAAVDRPTRESNVAAGQPAVPVVATTGGAGGDARPAVGRNTVERMIAQSGSQSKRTALFGVGGVLLVLALVAGYLIWQDTLLKSGVTTTVAQGVEGVRGEIPDLPPGTAAVASSNQDAVVYIEAGWKLIYTATGEQLYHAYMSNRFEVGPNRFLPLVGDDRNAVAIYVRVPDGQGGFVIEPFLTQERDGNVPIGAEITGSGFVVSSGGHILTNRHVAASWHTGYSFPGHATPGVILYQTPNGNWEVYTENGSPVLVEAPSGWVPSKTKQAGQRLSGPFEGRNDYLYVTLAKTSQRHGAKVSTISDVHDVTTIKLDLMGALQAVSMEDNYESIQPGGRVIVMGYPAASPPIYGVSPSQDAFNREASVRVIPNPSVTEGVVGKVIRGRDATPGQDLIVSEIGDVYQLDINTAGPGNSGGPVFDEQGRVIGIYFAGNNRLSFAVPIRYGMDVLGIRKVIE